MLVYDKKPNSPANHNERLNPYSIGCWSMTFYNNHIKEVSSLNPYSIGCWSMTANDAKVGSKAWLS